MKTLLATALLALSLGTAAHAAPLRHCHDLILGEGRGFEASFSDDGRTVTVIRHQDGGTKKITTLPCETKASGQNDWAQISWCKGGDEIGDYSLELRFSSDYPGALANFGQRYAGGEDEIAGLSCE